jgi:hypothetical protein
LAEAAGVFIVAQLFEKAEIFVYRTYLIYYFDVDK